MGFILLYYKNKTINKMQAPTYIERS